jgi:hypothetical protein
MPLDRGNWRVQVRGMRREAIGGEPKPDTSMRDTTMRDNSMDVESGAGAFSERPLAPSRRPIARFRRAFDDHGAPAPRGERNGRWM